MKYKVGDKVIFTHEEGLIKPVEAKVIKLTGGAVFPYIVRYGLNGNWTDDAVSEEELSPLEPEQLRQREQFFTDSEPDMVNHPPHYANKDPETINMIRAVLTEEEFIGGLK